MKTTMAMRAVMSVVLILVAELVSVRAQDTGLVVQVAWLGPGGVLLELEGVPTNVVIQVSEDLGSWHNQLDVSSRSNHVTVVDRDASLTNGGARFYRLRAPGVSVESAHSLWQAQALHSYTYHLQRTCWCLPEIIREADVTVREGQVVSATNVVYGLSPDPSWIPPDQPNLGSLMAIEQFFEMVVTAQQRLDLIAVSYDPSEGFPRRISVDDDFRSVDGEQEYYITWLTHSSPAPATSPTVGRSVPPDLPTLGTPTSDSIRVVVFGTPHTVRRPGYYDLPRSAVVRDAVEAAQGLSEFTWWRTYHADAGTGETQVASSVPVSTKASKWDYCITDHSVSRPPRFGGTRVFMVGGRRFTTSADFLSWVASLSPGTTLLWDSGCASYRRLPLEGSTTTMDEFKRICIDHQVEFTWRYGY